MIKRRHGLTILWAAILTLAAGVASAQQPPKVPDDVELLRNVPFGKGGQQMLAMHILRPKTLPKALMPVLVYVNGSAWGRDNKDMAIGRLIATARQGYFYIVHGDADTTVPYSQGKRLLASLTNAGVEATLYTVPGGNHGSPHLYDGKVLTEFFDKHLKEKTPP